MSQHLLGLKSRDDEPAVMLVVVESLVSREKHDACRLMDRYFEELQISPRMVMVLVDASYTIMQCHSLLPPRVHDVGASGYNKKTFLDWITFAALCPPVV